MEDNSKGKKKSHKVLYVIGLVLVLIAGILIGDFAGDEINDKVLSRFTTVKNDVTVGDTEAQTEDEDYVIAEDADSDSAVAGTTKMSEEQIQQGATELLNNLIEYSVSDTEKFKDLCMGFSEEDLQWFLDFLSGVYNEHYAKQIVKVRLSQDPYYGVYACCYTVAGTHPNTNLSNSTVNFAMSLTDEGWKVNNSEEAINTLNTPENYALLYPEEFADAGFAGRNVAEFDYAHVLDDTTVFEGVFDTSLAYLFQNEDGSVEALFWLANGTSGAVNVNQITVTVTDETLGVVLDQTVSCSEMVNAGYSKLVQFHFEPEQVLTGTQTWTTMEYNTSYQF